MKYKCIFSYKGIILEQTDKSENIKSYRDSEKDVIIITAKREYVDNQIVWSIFNKNQWIILHDFINIEKEHSRLKREEKLNRILYGA